LWRPERVDGDAADEDVALGAIAQERCCGAQHAGSVATRIDDDIETLAGKLSKIGGRTLAITGNASQFRKERDVRPAAIEENDLVASCEQRLDDMAADDSVPPSMSTRIPP